MITILKNPNPNPSTGYLHSHSSSRCGSSCGTISSSSLYSTGSSKKDNNHEPITENDNDVVGTKYNNNKRKDDGYRWWTGIAFGFMILTSTPTLTTPPPSASLQMNMMAYAEMTTATAATSTSSSSTTKNYDGFAEYAKDNQMEQSDVACFMNQCGTQTKELFRNPRGIKGIVCLGKCKGEQSCATRCFAQYNSPALNEWLSCTIEDEKCVKVPPVPTNNNVDNSAEVVGYSTAAIKQFDPTSLIGTWYKTNGLNPNYDLFDCQTNTFKKVVVDTGSPSGGGSTGSSTGTSSKTIQELDMDIFFRVQRPIESGGGYWENQLTEHMIVDDGTTTTKNTNDKNEKSMDRSTTTSTTTTTTNDNRDNDDTTGRTMYTSGKMYGLQFYENWYILGESDGTTSTIPPFKLVAYKGHTLQGNYEGAFVYAKEPILPIAAIPAVEAAAARAGLDFRRDFTVIDNTCPVDANTGPLNDDTAGTGTSTTDWIDLITGEGGVIDWISPGWRGEYATTNKM